MLKSKVTATVISAAAVLAMTACGGSGGGGGGTSALTGVVVDALVGGLDYNCTTSGLTGTTGTDGKFKYKAGDICAFSAGEVVLGSAPGKPVVTPLDFLTGANEDELANLLRFFQSLDSDDDLTNGITMPEGLTGTLNFAQDGGAFATALSDLIVDNELDDVAIGANTAMDHFYEEMTPYYQTAMTDAMFTGKMIGFKDGQIIFNGSSEYELVTDAGANVCEGTWSTSETILTLSQAECNGVAEADVIEIDFASEPAVDAQFRVKDGSSAPYDYAYLTVTSYGDAAVPASPTGLTSPSKTSSSVTLNWTDNSDNESEMVVGRSKNSDMSFAFGTAYEANTTAGTITGLDPDTTYYFNVKARNILGYSAETGEILSVTTLPLPPAAPTTLDYSTVTKSGVTLTWTDNADNESGFYVQSAPYTTLKPKWTTVDTLRANSTTYTFAGTVDTTYMFRVQAYNAGGVGSSNTLTTTTGKPDAPAGFTASKSYDKVGNLRTSFGWTDNADNETSFVLEYSTDDKAFSEYTDATVSKNATTKLISGPSGLDGTGITIYWRIKAVNDAGNSTSSNSFDVTY